jgi:hypothetical protein
MVLILVGTAATPAAGQETPLAGTTLTILLTAPVSDPIRTTLIDEATAIWRRENVRLLWLAGGNPGTTQGPSIRLLVLPKGRPDVRTDAKSLVVGELVRPDTGRAVAIVSINMAERIVRDASGGAPAGSRPDPVLVGLVLGRAAAHEIGHYLLDTRTHVPRGLMRARFEMTEFADPRSTAFRLDPMSAGSLSERVRREGPTTALTPLREAVGVTPAP